METIGYSQLVKRFSKVNFKQLQWISPINDLTTLFVEQSQQPQNLKDSFFDPNDFFVLPKQDNKKKSSTKEVILSKKVEQKQIDQNGQQRKKVYKAGPFALFYQMNESTLDKDVPAWYYKDHKDIIGPVSSYNMDKMVYYKKIEDQTRVAYKSIQKFVKFSKIKKLVEDKLEQN